MMKKMILLALMGVIFINGLVFADESNPHVDYVLEYQLMDTFKDGFFAPKSHVSILESLAIVHRVLESTGVVDSELLEQYLEDYEVVLERLGIPRELPPFSYDIHSAVSYALGNGLISLESLELLLDGDMLKRTDKETFASLMGRSLNFFLNEDFNAIIALTYRDDSEISLDARRHIMFLVDHGVLTGKGDIEGNFNPKMLVTREMMAEFASQLHRVIFSKVVGTGLEYPEEEIVVEGFVKEIHIKETPEVTVLDYEGNIRTFATSKAAVYEHGLYELRLNQEIRLTVSTEGIVKVALVPRIIVEPMGLEVQIIKVYEDVNLLMTMDKSGDRRILSFPESRGVKAANYPEGAWVFVQGTLLHNWLYEVHWISVLNQ